MPQIISELFHTTSQSPDLTVEIVKAWVLNGLLGVAGGYYLLVSLKSMLSRSRGQIKPPIEDGPDSYVQEDARGVGYGK